MNRLRMFSPVMACSLALLFPFYAHAVPGNSCRQLQRDLDRQIDDLKESQKSDLQQCGQTSGRNSNECRLLRDRQDQELSGTRADRAGRVAACRGHGAPASSLSSTQSGIGLGDSYLANRGYCVEYPYFNCRPPDYRVDRRHHRHHHHGPESQGTATASTGGGKPASGGGSAGNSGSSSSSSASASSGGSHGGGGSTHSGYTGSSGGNSGSPSSTGASSGSFHGGSGTSGGSAGSGSHDSGGKRPN